MSQTQQLEALLTGLLHGEFPEVAKRADVSVGYAQRAFTVTVKPEELRVAIRFDRQALTPDSFLEAVRGAALVAQQLILNERFARREEAAAHELWLAAQRRLPCSD